ncbi:hypothetical protein CPB84DRAFT_1844789 [Gymnopilus junonius]|uniref:G-protein coupled receptors family 2 profile 2 domain-containing protein n=1 Tax=Gymnopilus junonius TaxID=109634 RepID=A0A9P5TQQ3_GYMJU|nr:hypothetical protein CPB84DRAFT_1844789 [Gymnopilus junonius]
MSSNSSDPSGGDGGGFIITDSQINFANNLASFGTIPGTCVCFLVLVAYGIVAYFPHARKYLDRVSFRLLVYALVSNVGFGIAYAATPAAPGPGCNFGAFCVNLFLTFSTFFTTSIAINLQLVLVHHKNGQHLEKYYLIGTFILTIVLNVPTFALHQFGWDEESETCWYKNGDPDLKLRWIIGTQSFWIALAATIETVCSVIILAWMYLYQRTTRALGEAVLQAGPLGREGTKSITGVTAIKTKGTATKAIGTKGSSPKISSTRVDDAARVEDFIRKRPTDITRDPRYRNAILRIALYPIVSLLCNYPTVALDLNTTIRAGLNTQGDYRLLVLDLLFYAIRPLAYGLIAVTDPSFIIAIREMMGKTYNTRNRSNSDKMSANMEFASVRAGARSGRGTATQTRTGQEASQAQSEAPNMTVNGGFQEKADEHEHRSNLGSNVGVIKEDEEIGIVEISYEEEFRRINRQL